MTFPELDRDCTFPAGEPLSAMERDVRHPIRSKGTFAAGIGTIGAALLMGRLVPGQADLILALIGALCAIQGMHQMPVLGWVRFAGGVTLLIPSFIASFTEALPVNGSGTDRLAPWMAYFGGLLMAMSRLSVRRRVLILPWRASPDPTEPHRGMVCAALLLFFIGVQMDGYGPGSPGPMILLSVVILMSAAHLEKDTEVLLPPASAESREGT